MGHRNGEQNGADIIADKLGNAINFVYDTVHKRIASGLNFKMETAQNRKTDRKLTQLWSVQVEIKYRSHVLWYNENNNINRELMTN